MIEPNWIKVLNHLDRNGPATSKDLVAALNIPRRTVFSATRKLLRDGWITQRVSLKDTRQYLFIPKVQVMN